MACDCCMSKQLKKLRKGLLDQNEILIVLINQFEALLSTMGDAEAAATLAQHIRERTAKLQAAIPDIGGGEQGS